MAEDKNINLMPEDLRKKEESIKKSNWSFVPDLTAPASAKNKGSMSKPSGSSPSIWSKMFASLKPVPKVKPLASPKPLEPAKPILEPVIAPEIKSPIYVAPDIKAMSAKPAPTVNKVEEHIQDFVSDKKVKVKSSGPSWWSKMLASLKPAPKVKPPLSPKPLEQAKAKPTPAPTPVLKSPIYIAPEIKQPSVQPIINPINNVKPVQDFLVDKKIPTPKLKTSGPSWWQRLLNFFKPKPRAPKIPKATKPEASVLTQAIKRNGYKVEKVSPDLHQVTAKPFDSPKQDLKNLDANKEIEDILDLKTKTEMVAKPTPAPEPDIILPKIEAKPAPTADFSIPSSPVAPVKPTLVEAKNNNNKFHQPEFLNKGALMGEMGSVDLIPQAVRLRTWRQVNSLLFLSGIASIIIVGVFYGTLFVQEQAIIKEQKRQEEERIKIEKQILNFSELNKNIKSLGEEINLVQDVLNKHIYWNKFFALLEKYTLPEVFYGGITAGNNGALTLSASATNYEAVARQLKVLQQDQAKEFVESVAINAASIGDGGVRFSVNLILNPNLFYYDKQ